MIKCSTLYGIYEDARFVITYSKNKMAFSDEPILIINFKNRVSTISIKLMSGLKIISKPDPLYFPVPNHIHFQAINIFSLDKLHGA